MPEKKFKYSRRRYNGIIRIDDTRQRIKDVIAQHMRIPVDSIFDDSILVDDLNFVGFDLSCIISKLQKEFNINIDFDWYYYLTSDHATVLTLLAVVLTTLHGDDKYMYEHIENVKNIYGRF